MVMAWTFTSTIFALLAACCTAALCH
jgi:hypothetical protein